MLTKVLAAISATVALSSISAPAMAAVYDFSLTGVVADGSYSTFGNSRFYDLALSADDSFAPFELQIGDVLNLTVTLDGFLTVPSSTDYTFFGVDVLTDPSQLASAPAGGVTSSSSLTVGDGNLAGDTYYLACSNCVSGSMFLQPGPEFQISQFTTSITIENLAAFDGGDGPITVTGFQLGYQATDAVSAAVPEPATWALMILGFGAAGGALRSRRRTVTA